MTRKTSKSHMQAAVAEIQAALRLEKRNLHLMLLLVRDGDLWHHFDDKTCSRMAREFNEHVKDGLPSTMTAFKMLYPELFYENASIGVAESLRRDDIERTA